MHGNSLNREKYKEDISLNSEKNNIGIDIHHTAIVLF